MARGNKPKGRKEVTFQDATLMFPSLHEDVVEALSDEPIHPAPWYNPSGTEDDAIETHNTFVMGRFSCYNPKCSQKIWGSKKVAIQIRGFLDNGYNAVVFKQRCKSCNWLGVLRLHEKSYVERLEYRLKKWADIATDRPEYDGSGKGRPHESRLCEGCKRGYCTAGGDF
ncbi:hypothetical protein RB595_002610 [Gaeumannomyces hyphopodioides]